MAGRPTLYDDDMVEKVYCMASDGKTNQEIADTLGVTRTTLQNWLNEYVDLFNALKKGKSTADDNVEAAAYKRAIGYDVTETHVSKNGDPFETNKHIPGDTTAQIFWLKNRKPKEWRERVDINQTSNINIKHEHTLKGDKLDERINEIEAYLQGVADAKAGTTNSETATPEGPAQS